MKRFIIAVCFLPFVLSCSFSEKQKEFIETTSKQIAQTAAKTAAKRAAKEVKAGKSVEGAAEIGAAAGAKEGAYKLEERAKDYPSGGGFPWGYVISAIISGGLGALGIKRPGDLSPGDIKKQKQS